MKILTLCNLYQVINEILRIHSIFSFDLSRIVSPGLGVTICDRHFFSDIVLSVPAYIIHRSTFIWDSDAEDFRFERWASENLTEKQKASFISFSYEPRSCVGRNVTEMKSALIVTTVTKRYSFELRQDEWKTRESFLRKPLECMMGLKWRGWRWIK